MRTRFKALPVAGCLLALGLTTTLSGTGYAGRVAGPIYSDAHIARYALERAGIRTPDIEEIAAKSDALQDVLSDLGGRLGVSEITLDGERVDPRQPWIADQVDVYVQARHDGEPASIRAPSVVVVQGDLNYIIENSPDCRREAPLEIELDPTSLVLYQIENLNVTCVDASGTLPTEALFVKTGRSGGFYTEPAVSGSTGAPVGATPSAGAQGQSCGDNGVDGADAAATPGSASTGGSGANGSSGSTGGNVAPTYFTVRGAIYGLVSVDLTGGTGGDGQNGGLGGMGGAGQNGGDAADGREACCEIVCEPPPCHLVETRAPGLGGIGGNGGNGASGGRGGDGGSAGNGGNGGAILALIEKSSYALFDVVSVRGGAPGRSGFGGSGGAGGVGGKGGRGGEDGVNCSFQSGDEQPNGADGSFGSGGLAGSNGGAGVSGADGRDIVVPLSDTSARLR